MKWSQSAIQLEGGFLLVEENNYKVIDSESAFATEGPAKGPIKIKMRLNALVHRMIELFPQYWPTTASSSASQLDPIANLSVARSPSFVI